MSVRRVYIWEMVAEVFGLDPEAVKIVMLIFALLVVTHPLLKDFKLAFRKSAGLRLAVVLLAMVAASVVGLHHYLNRILPERKADDMLAEGRFEDAETTYKALGLMDKAEYARVEGVRTLAEAGLAEAREKRTEGEFRLNEQLLSAVMAIEKDITNPELATFALEHDEILELLFDPESNRSFTFGKYQDDPVNWTVLDREKDAVLLFSSNEIWLPMSGNIILYSSRIRDSTTSCWRDSGLRKRIIGNSSDRPLDERLFESNGVRTSIITTLNKNTEYLKGNIVEGEMTEDRLFPLSKKEIKRYGLQYNDPSNAHSNRYWTRDVSAEAGKMCVANAQPYYGVFFADLNVEENANVRLAMWVNYRDLLSAFASEKQKQAEESK